MSYEFNGCPIRYGLGILGDRWSLLIIRDMMFKGRQYYGEFLSAGEGISTNILADRLQKLESAGVIFQSPDPDHGKRIVYKLTQKGADLMPVLLAIIEWSAQYDELTEVPDQFIDKLRKKPKTLQREHLARIDRE